MRSCRPILALTALMFLSLAVAPSTASACKADTCAGSMAPTTLNQVGGGGGGGGGNNNGGNTPPTSQQYQQCQNYAQQSMTGSSLYAEMQSLPAQQQYAFFNMVMGSGGGMNDLSAQVISNMFGGNMTAYNSWINDNFYGTNGYSNTFRFNPATGVITQAPSNNQVGSVSSWTCPYYP